MSIRSGGGWFYRVENRTGGGRGGIISSGGARDSLRAKMFIGGWWCGVGFAA